MCRVKYYLQVWFGNQFTEGCQRVSVTLNKCRLHKNEMQVKYLHKFISARYVLVTHISPIYTHTIFTVCDSTHKQECAKLGIIFKVFE